MTSNFFERQLSCGDPCFPAVKTASHPGARDRSRSQGALVRDLRRVGEKLEIGPGKFFRPTKGLCALFSRTGTLPTLRSRHRKPPVARRSYADAVKTGPMAYQNHGNDNGPARGGGPPAGFFPGFNPGYAPGFGGRGGNHGRGGFPPRGRGRRGRGRGHGGFDGGFGYRSRNYGGRGRGWDDERYPYGNQIGGPAYHGSHPTGGLPGAQLANMNGAQAPHVAADHGLHPMANTGAGFQPGPNVGGGQQVARVATGAAMLPNQQAGIAVASAAGPANQGGLGAAKQTAIQ